MNFFYEYEKINNTKLQEYITRNLALHNYFSFKKNAIYTKNYCGMLQVEDDVFFILPKIANQENQNLKTFIYMFIIANDLKLKNEEIASLENLNIHFFLEALIQLFARRLIEELRFGVYRSYVLQEERLRSIKGAYLVLENSMSFDKTKIHCRYDEFSSDNILNRFFLYAIDIFTNFTQDKKQLFECAYILGETQKTQIDINRVGFHFDRLSSRYQPSYEMAMLLLKHLVPTFTAGQKGFAFLFDMNELFERFVAKIAKEIDPSIKVQYSKSFGNLQLQPDIMTDTMIIDTKYKKIRSKEEINTADKYQMFAYGQNFKKDTMLLYPKHLYDIDTTLTLGVGEESVRMEVRSLELDCGDIGFKDYWKTMKKRVERIVR